MDGLMWARIERNKAVRCRVTGPPNEQYVGQRKESSILIWRAFLSSEKGTTPESGGEARIQRATGVTPRLPFPIFRALPPRRLCRQKMCADRHVVAPTATALEP